MRLDTNVSAGDVVVVNNSSAPYGSYYDHRLYVIASLDTRSTYIAAGYGICVCRPAERWYPYSSEINKVSKDEYEY